MALIAAVGLIAGARTASASTTKPAPKPVKPVCDLVKATPKGLPDPSLDITSADVATNKTELTWVVRVVKMSGDPNTHDPLGRAWSFSFASGKVRVGFTAYAGPFGDHGDLSQSTVTLDTTTNEIRYSVPLSAVAKEYPAANLTPGSVFTTFQVNTGGTDELPASNDTGVYSAGSLIWPSTPDAANSATKYVAGSPSCLKVGT
jgi:hypothetical protein